MAVVRWTFEDPTAAQTYEFEINPNDGGSPGYERNVSYQNTSAPDGKTLIFEGAPRAQELEFSGTLLTQEQYDAFVTWWQKKNQVKMTDDLGREWWIVITRFAPTRERSVHYPWKHSYSVTAVIVDWP
jgi:hypothetical protein